MRVIPLKDIQRVASSPVVLAAVRDALIRHAAVGVISPMPGALLFDQPPGDCHIKYGRFKGGDYYVIKVASGFYDNPKRGLPTNNGLMIVFSAQTGEPLALLHDQGWLTNARTAAAGALAVEAGRSSRLDCLGIIGTGEQAELQALWATGHNKIERVAIWGRDGAKADLLATKLCAQGLSASTVPQAEYLFGCAQVIITCTPSAEPVLPMSDIPLGTLIVAMGADNHGKQELATGLIPQADCLICDDRAQSLDHGEFQTAMREGLIDPARTVLLGDCLAKCVQARRSDKDIIIIDLTGLPAQDIGAASTVYDALTRRTADHLTA